MAGHAQIGSEEKVAAFMEAPVHAGTAHVEMRVPFAASSVPMIRRMLRRWLDEQHASDDAIDNASIVISELVANAVRHAQPLSDGCLLVAWRQQGDAVLISVTDGGGATAPHAVDAPVSATSGRGLTIVESLSHRWWMEQHTPGTTVHTELSLS